MGPVVIRELCLWLPGAMRWEPSVCPCALNLDAYVLRMDAQDGCSGAPMHQGWNRSEGAAAGLQINAR